MVYLNLSLEPWSKIHEDHVNKKLWLAVQKRINKVVLRVEYGVKVGNFSRFLFEGTEMTNHYTSIAQPMATQKWLQFTLEHSTF
jgi:hypothetical protein